VLGFSPGGFTVNSPASLNGQFRLPVSLSRIERQAAATYGEAALMRR